MSAGPPARTTPEAAPSALLIGACSLHEVIAPLRPHLSGVTQAWRRPTIALMAPPLPPGAATPPPDTPPRIARYIARDLAKAHLADLRATRADLLVFELIRDVVTGVVRVGESWVANPFQLLGLPGERPLRPTPGGLPAALGLDGGHPQVLGFRHPERFLPVWREAFRQFRAEVLEPQLARGGRVILYQARFTERVLGDAGTAWGRDPATAPKANALLEAMEAEARALPGLDVVSVPEPLRVTAADVPWGGPAYTHYIPEAYAFAADGLARLVLGHEVEAAAWAALRRAEAAAALGEAQRSTAAARDALGAEAVALRRRLAEAEQVQAQALAAAAAVRPAPAEAEASVLRRLGRGLLRGSAPKPV